MYDNLDMMTTLQYPLYDSSSCFPVENIPFGIFSTKDQNPHCCTRIGDYVIDLSILENNNAFPDLCHVFSQSSLNAFIRLGKSSWKSVRSKIQDLYHSKSEILLTCCFHISNVQLHLPIEIGDYTDFYASKEHATNVGTMFRGADNALNPNWVHMPIGYHGRASSIVVSETEIIRPSGQIKPKDSPPFFGSCEKLDFELEMAFVIGKENQQGHPVKMNQVSEYIFGMVLMNDWSARDIQSWEYVPLGPFLGKNFATTISPWIVTMEALAPFAIEKPIQQPEPLPYLKESFKSNYNIELKVFIQTRDSNRHHLCTSNLRYMYWSIYQQLVHHTITGCNMRIGDICGTGTISGPDSSNYGSMLELCWNGSKPIQIGSFQRTFLEDYDRVIITGVCNGNGFSIGFGECSGLVLPAIKQV